MSSELVRLLRGALLTLEISGLATVAGVIVGTLLAVARRSSPLGRRLVGVYVSLIRGTPLFIQVLVLFFLLPGIGIDLPKFTTAVLALALNSGAYVSEIIRGALTAIPKGQEEAARALGMRAPLIWIRVLLPQVLRIILPPLIVEFTALLKGSALLTVIGVVELTRTAQQIIAVTYEPTRTWLVVALLYFVMCFVLGQATRLSNHLLVGRSSPGRA